MATDWICCQLGAREHYAVPRALHRLGRLRLLVTDAWTGPGGVVAHLPGQWPRRLSERFHPELKSAQVRDFTWSLVRQEVEWRLHGVRDWELTMARNEWFQREAASVVRDAGADAGAPVAVFAHSYSALGVFQAAKARGWRTVLGQIDPGEEHFAIVRRLSDVAPHYGPAPPGPPIHYFEHWRQECALADRIVVNSDWTRRAIARAGIDTAKITVVPLAHENGDAAPPPARAYPERFTAERPLRLLFVGSVSVVKGVPELLDAMALVSDLPVTLRLVGPTAMVVPAAVSRLSAIDLVGAVPRGDMVRYYDSSDALVFPSHSDGFGMAQIEAQARGLPIMASAHCGQVVADGVSGVVLPAVTARSIADAIRRLAARPALLAAFSEQARHASRSTLQPLGEALTRMLPS